MKVQYYDICINIHVIGCNNFFLDIYLPGNKYSGVAVQKRTIFEGHC